ncbi:MAG: AraC family transcriptional regulator [Clostridia bacterium]|nr:AraC family transcriptional regulator [Clostridia bacterium]
MKTDSVYKNISTDENMRENVSHGSLEYPFAYYYEDVWDFDFHCVDWHWHPEIEFVYVERGEMSVMIGSDRLKVGADTGLFINTRVIHRFEASESVIIPNIVFSEKLLASEESLIYRKYVYPILFSSQPYQMFNDSIAWQRVVLDILKTIFALQKEEKPHELETVELLLRMWRVIYQNTQIRSIAEHEMPASEKQAQLQIMMQYIQDHYQKAMTLDEIAASVMISKSAALKLFARFLKISPISYLIRYRLQCAAGFLLSTEQTVDAISQETGFNDSAYFCRKFKELYQLTPSEYRRMKSKVSVKSVFRI